MKNLFLAILFSTTTLSAFAQLGVSYHESSMPFVGINYEYQDKYLGEIRVSSNNYFEELAFEITANYIFLSSDDFDFYGGIGGRTTHFEGLVIPVGLNLYPFENDRFGFHLEAAGLFGEGAILRGSWGIRYRFGGKTIE